MRFKTLKIRGFRGFNEEQAILLDSNVILIYGLNGSGKSSFTESLEWLFFGEISRQRLSRCKSEYQHEEYLKNLFYSSTENPFVEVEGCLNGAEVVVRKEISPEGDKFFINGKKVDDFESLSLNLENYFRPMLAQTEIKALVDSEQKDRWEQLSSILGQDDLTKLRENLMSLRNNKRDESYKKQEMKLNTILNDISDVPSLSSLLGPIKQLDLSDLISQLKEIVGSSSKSLANLLTDIKTKQKSLLNTELGKRVAEISYNDSNSLKKYLNELSSHLIELENQAIKATSEGHDHNYLDFLKGGKNFVKIPECPFCLEKTLTSERLTDIDKVIEEGKEAQQARLQFQEQKNSIDLWMESFPERIKAYLPQQKELKIISQKFLDIGEEQLVSLLQELDKKITGLIPSFTKDIKTATDNYFSFVEKKYYHKQKVEENPREKLTNLNNRLIFEIQAIITEWDNLKSKIAEKLPLTGKVDQEELKKWILLEKINTFFSEGEAFIKQTNLLKIVDSTQQKLEQYEKNEVSRLLNEHAGEIKSYYDKLNLGDRVQFSGIEVKGGIRRQAKLKAEAFGKEVNPVTFFSEAHTNSLALSIYFPQRVDRNSTWESVILDDPVQSMDENHSQALIDILVDISSKKQLIVLTHSKAFFRRLCARFGHIKPKVYSFFYNENKGPSIVLSEGETLDYLNLIEENCKKGDPKSLETASTQLRKAMESVCFEFLLDKGVSFSKAQKIQKSSFSSLFAEVETLGLPASETGKLKSLLDTSHSDSHAWSIADTTPGGIRKGADYVRKIYDDYLK